VQISISDIEKRYLYSLNHYGVSIYTSAMVLPYNAAAITTLDRLEFESNRIGQNVPNFDVGKSPSDIAVDEVNNIIYVTNTSSNTVSVIDGDTLKVLPVNVGESPESIAVDDYNNIAY
jgi:YVTN family beta-propeller protein